MMNKKANIIIWCIIILVVLIFLSGLIYHFTFAMTRGTETIVIKEKWVKYRGNDAKYLVSSQQGEVYQITDTFWAWRWNSSDLYAYLQPGMICQIKTQGWRFAFFSDYKNILKAECN